MVVHGETHSARARAEPESVARVGAGAKSIARAIRPGDTRGLRRSITRCAVAAAALAASGAAWAAAGAAGGRSELVFLAQIVALLAVGRLLGELMQRLGQPAVMGQLLAGLALGPSVLGAVWPQGWRALFPASPEQSAMLDGVAQLGVLLLLVMTGMETDVALVRRVRRAAASVSVAGGRSRLSKLHPDGKCPR